MDGAVVIAVALVIVVALVIALVASVVLSAPSIDAREHRALKRDLRQAVQLLERSINDPIYPTTIDFNEKATAVVDRYYKEG